MAPILYGKVLEDRASRRPSVDRWRSGGDTGDTTPAVQTNRDKRRTGEASDADRQRSLLAIFDLLPDLLATAYEEDGSSTESVLEIQDRLVEEHRSEGAPFKWSVSYPNVSVCPTCNASLPVVKWEMENPSVVRDSIWRTMHLWNETVHQVRQHGAQFSPEVAAFLEGVRETWAGQ
jgi:hypothetical protein